jgi:hypothetical protein
MLEKKTFGLSKIVLNCWIISCGEKAAAVGCGGTSWCFRLVDYLAYLNLCNDMISLVLTSKGTCFTDNMSMVNAGFRPLLPRIVNAESARR